MWEPATAAAATISIPVRGGWHAHEPRVEMHQADANVRRLREARGWTPVSVKIVVASFRQSERPSRMAP